ncbi:bifunctional (p)ppGpp synthetase/guanosine-3',5'-bis(diphosphate) 3'-pyrophosphohydrolase [Candidatus Woesearchaeota archaeon]|nr:bifunctional (p)ppGpp synthetase/guanosine-3',5'-bis(diphosphate) 3'-pyrophosphohydrolase [Candidatus Woesearchaeota archaeon]
MHHDQVTYKKLIEQASEYLEDEDLELVELAYNFAEKAHRGQKRTIDGEPYVIHPLEVALILAEVHMDAQTISAGLLHDVVEDTTASYDEVKDVFGEDIMHLVEGVTKIEKVRFRTFDEYTAENLKKILFATAKDVRVMVVKLADRLNNMTTLETFGEEKQKRIAKETLDIYAPIAHKLGMWQIKGELEDLSLRHLDPKTYYMLKDKINEKRTEREKYTEKVIKKIISEVRKEGIQAKITGRAKYFYSIYQKMHRKGKELEEIYDLIALRIITKNIPECYVVLEIIKRLYRPLEGRFKDYVARPKKNQYQSIHVDVVTPEHKVLEIQLRTDQMHHMAEEGIAAHWRYKELDKDKLFDRKIGWVKQILDWKKEFQGKEFVDSLKIDLFKDEIVVLTPKGDTIILPEGSTPVDFAYAVHTMVGHNCSKAEVNGSVAPLDQQLKSGDVVKIHTQKNVRPSRNWLNFVKTSKAKSKIRGVLNIRLDKDSKYYRTKESIETNLLEFIDYKSKKNLKLSKCCNPRFGDEIVAFKTKDGSITIHNKKCPNIFVFDQDKAIMIGWKEEVENIKSVLISVRDRIGLIDEILDKSLECKVNVMNINIKSHKKNLLIYLKVRSDDDNHLKDSLKEFLGINGVFNAEIEAAET